MKADVLARLRDDRDLAEPVRRAALKIAGRRRQGPDDLLTLARPAIARKGAPKAEYELALRRVDEGLKTSPDLLGLRVARGMALYRLDRLGEAVTTLSAEAVRTVPGSSEYFLRVAYLAMCQARLGHKGEAERLLDTLGGMVNKWTSDETRVLAVETAAVVGSTAGADREAVAGRLFQIVLALQAAYEPNGSRFPRPAIVDEAGKPLLSWRVALLPYLGQKPLYDRFHLDEPWDSPHNLALVREMPEVFQVPRSPDNAAGRTHYRIVTGPETAFPDPGATLADFKDGTSSTAIVLEAAVPVEWTSPEEPRYSRSTTPPRLGALPNGRASVAMADATVISIDASRLSDTQFRTLLTKDGGEKLDVSRLPR